MQKLLVVLSVTTFLFVLPMSAGAAGLVPCGGTGEQPCTTCDVVKLTNNVVAWLVMILGTIAAILIVVAGARLVTSGGNMSAKEQAKSSMTNLIIGYLIVLSAWLVLDYGLKALLIQDGTNNFGVWNEVSCIGETETDYNEFEQEEVVWLEPELGNVQGWVLGENTAGGEDGSAGAWNAACKLLPGPPGVNEYDCSTQIAQCKAQKGIPILNTQGSTVICQPSRSDGGGTNPPNLSAGGACNINLISPYFGSQSGNAQCIIRNESACGANSVSRSDVMKIDGRAFSFGPMQINLTVHVLKGCSGYPAVLDCKSAFSGKNYKARVINESLYQQCARAAQNQICNIKNGARIYKEAGNSWKPWSTAAGCGLR